MNLSEIVALLCNEPFCLEVEKAKRLTLFQVRKLYLRARDKQTGAIILNTSDSNHQLSRELKQLAHKAIRVPLWYVEKRNAGNA